MYQRKGVEAMKKIVLLCAAGMSGSLLVTKMHQAAKEACFLLLITPGGTDYEQEYRVKKVS